MLALKSILFLKISQKSIYLVIEMRNIILILLIISCELENNSKEEPIARVNDNFLFFSEIQESLDENMSQNDSMLAVNSAINNWASKKLLYEKAIFNLSNSKQNELDLLVKSYESDLYISNYEKEWLKTRVDTCLLYTSPSPRDS